MSIELQTETDLLTEGATPRVLTAPTWAVAQTKSRQEKALAADLDAMGISYYLPLVKTVRYYGRRKLKRMLPLFSGYIFLCGTRAELIAADRTRQFVQYLKPPDPQRLQRELHSIKLALEKGGVLIPVPTLARGVTVEVKSGPFRGLCGVVASMADATRVVLNVDLIGRAAALEIDRDLLQLI